MPIDPQEQQQRIAAARNGLQQYIGEMSRVRELEQRVPEAQDRGYNINATRGYQQWIETYQALEADQLTPEMNGRLDRMSGILTNIRDEFNIINRDQSPQAQRDFVARRMEELRTTGETFMRTGHDRHFNVVRVRALPDGGYSYTLYDAGHESTITRRDENGNLRVNSVVERRLLPGVDPAGLINDEMVKMLQTAETPLYNVARSRIDARLETTPMRVFEDVAQTRNNCSTMGQRILFQDITGDQQLTGRLYAFITNPDQTPAGLDRQLQAKSRAVELGRPETIRAINVDENGWAPYRSGGGEAYRYNTPFTNNGSHTPEMDAFEQRMRESGIEIRWGERNGNTYAYVLQSDAESYDRLRTRLGITPNVQETTRLAPQFVPAVDPAQANMRRFLEFGLGQENVLNVERIPGATRLQVPENFSRDNLSRLGVDPAGLDRTNHVITIPDERLPMAMRQQMERLSRGSALGAASPLPQQQQQTGGLHTPEEAAAISQGQRNIQHRTQELAQAGRPVDEALRIAQEEARTGARLVEPPVTPQPVQETGPMRQTMTPQQQQVGGINNPPPNAEPTPSRAPETNEGRIIANRLQARDGHLRRDMGGEFGPDPHAPLRNLSTTQPATAVEVDAIRAQLENNGVLTDNFGRPLTTDPRTGERRDPILTSRAQYEAQLAENERYFERQRGTPEVAPTASVEAPTAEAPPRRPNQGLHRLASAPANSPAGREFDRVFETRTAAETRPTAPPVETPRPAAAPAAPSPTTTPSETPRAQAPRETPQARPHSRTATVASHSIGIATAGLNGAAAVQAWREGRDEDARAYAGRTAQAAGMEVALSNTGIRTAARAGEVVAERAGARAGVLAFRAIGGKVPVVGAVIGAGFGIWETGAQAWEAAHGRASWTSVGVTFGSGVISTASGLFGFVGLGAGEVVQEGYRELTRRTLGEQNAARHSAVVELGIMATDMATGGPNQNRVHGNFSGRMGGANFNRELGEIAGEFARTNWGQYIGNGDRNVTVAELRAEMQEHNITIAEIDANRDGNISGREMSNALNAHHVQRDRPNLNAPAPQAAPRDWRAEQAAAAQRRAAAAAAAAASNGNVHSSFTGRMGGAHLNAELAEIKGEMDRTNWGRFIGNGDAQITVAEMREVMQRYNIRISEIDRNGDGNIGGREFTNALQAHGVANHPVRSGGNGR